MNGDTDNANESNEPDSNNNETKRYTFKEVALAGKSFKCKPNCGECCCCVTLPYSVWEKNSYKSERHLIKSIDDNGQGIIPITTNNFCALLSLDNQCLAYADRPLVCWAFGLIPELPCPYFHIDGTARTEAETEQIHSDIRAMLWRVYHRANKE